METQVINIIVEMWPQGSQILKRQMGRMTISNDGTGNITKGNYNIQVYKGESNRCCRKGRVENYLRKGKTFWYLLYLSLKSIYGEKDQYRLPGQY